MVPTLKTVAERAGVSRQAAGLILNGRLDLPYHSETRRRVLQAAQELGYRPNASALAVRRGRFDCLALLQDMTGARSDFQRDLIAGIEARTIECGRHLIFSSLTASPAGEESNLPAILTRLLTDGLLLNYHREIPTAMQALLSERNIPAVWINTRAECNAVYPDDFAASKQLTRNFIRDGRRRIAFLEPYIKLKGLVAPHYSSASRLDGYTEAMREAGLPLPTMLLFDYWMVEQESLIVAFHEWFCRPDRPDAIIANLSTLNACFALVRAAERAKIRIPNDMDLGFFREHPMNLGVPVQTLLLPWAEVGRRAVDLLIQLIDTKEANLPAIQVPIDLSDGSSNGHTVQSNPRPKDMG